MNQPFRMFLQEWPYVSYHPVQDSECKRIERLQRCFQLFYLARQVLPCEMEATLMLFLGPNPQHYEHLERLKVRHQ